MKSSVLGRGLAQLIGDQAESGTNEVPVSAIVPNRRQPRTVFDQLAVEELAESIRQVGVLQPLVVRPLSEGVYELIAGERRLRASKLAGLDSVPVVVRSADDQGVLELALIENLQREDISPLESARAYRRLIDEFGLTQESVAQRVGKSRVAVANTVRLLKLPDPILSALERGSLTEGHARALLGLPNAVVQVAVYEQVVEGDLTVKQVEQLAKKIDQPKRTRSRRGGSKIDPNWEALRVSLESTLGAPVHIEGSASGGRIVIDFYSEDDLSRVAEVIEGAGR